MQQYDNVEMSEKSNEIEIRMECMDNKTVIFCTEYFIFINNTILRVYKKSTCKHLSIIAYMLNTGLCKQQLTSLLLTAVNDKILN